MQKQQNNLFQKGVIRGSAEVRLRQLLWINIAVQTF